MIRIITNNSVLITCILQDNEDDGFGDFSCQEENDGIWCQHGKLFIDGSSSGDVVQVCLLFSKSFINR